MALDTPLQDHTPEASEPLQTAEEFLQSQLQLESDAREALPYQFDTCTKALGPLRQLLFSCLTCNPPPESPDAVYAKPAAVCYSCSISCHGDHQLVELFNKRAFTCDCGSSRFSSQVPCTLQLNPSTRQNGGVHSTKPRKENKYGKNFRNLFCGCNTPYDAESEQGTMFQCIGLPGGCGEDWWHPECVVGVGKNWNKGQADKGQQATPIDTSSVDAANTQENELAKLTTANLRTATAGDDADEADGESSLPPGFPAEDDFEAFICYICLDSNPWLKKYALMGGKFLPPVFHKPHTRTNVESVEDCLGARKRKADEISADAETTEVEHDETVEPKRTKLGLDPTIPNSESDVAQSKVKLSSDSCKLSTLPLAPAGLFSLFLADDFREDLCRCSDCLSKFSTCPGVLEEDEAYEPPLSADGSNTGDGAGSLGSHSLYDRGEAALNSVDRVRALEGLMVYNNLKGKLKTFFQPFAESKTPVSAEDIKTYFAKLRGDKENAAPLGTENEDPTSGYGTHREEGEGY